MKNKYFFLGAALVFGVTLTGCDLFGCKNGNKCSVTYGSSGGSSCGASKCDVPVGYSTGTAGTTVKCSC